VILRRMINSLRSQNWLSLSLELLVLVSGVFLGLQVDDWNEARKDRLLETAYLDRLYADTLFNIESVGGIARELEARLSALAHITRVIEGRSDDVITLDEQNITFCRWYITREAGLRTATYDELVSTGKLDIIDDENLREILQRAHALHAISQRQIDAFGDMAYQKALILQPFIEWRTVDQGGVQFDNFSSLTACSVDLGAISASADARTTLVHLYRVVRTFTEQRRLQMDELSSLKAELESAMAVRASQ
jgi:hypothetical protein